MNKKEFESCLRLSQGKKLNNMKNHFEEKIFEQFLQSSWRNIMRKEN